MNRPWMPLYIADYRADTAHLSAAEHGAYLLLIMHYWQTGGLPTTDAPLARIACMTPAQWRSAKSTISTFFTPDWKHKRIDEELAKTAEISSKRRIAAEQRHNKSNANAVQLDTQPLSQSQSKKEKENSIGRSPSAMRPDDFEKFWLAYPKRDGANPKAPARKIFLACVKAGVDPAVIVAGAAACRERDAAKVGTPYIPQAVKWLRDRRWEDYAAPEPSATGPPQPPSPDMPSDAELRAYYEGATNGTDHGKDLRGAGNGVHESVEPIDVSDVRPRQPGMRGLGSVLPRPARVAAVGHEGARGGDHPADDGPDPMA